MEGREFRLHLCGWRLGFEATGVMTRNCALRVIRSNRPSPHAMRPTQHRKGDFATSELLLPAQNAHQDDSLKYAPEGRPQRRSSTSLATKLSPRGLAACKVRF